MEGNPILRPFGSRDTGFDSTEIEFQHACENRVRLPWLEPEALLLGVPLDEPDPMRFAPRELEVAQGFLVDGEEAARRTVLRRHVCEGRPVGQRKVGHTGPEEFDEFPHDTVLSQHVGNDEDEVCGTGTVRQTARQPDTHDFRNQHGDRVAEHGGLRLDAADTPAENCEAVDHRGVAVSPDHTVRVSHLPAIAFGYPDNLCKVFEIDLMADAGPGRHHTEVGECARSPAEEFVPLAVPFEFQSDVAGKRVVGCKPVDHDRVVDDQVDRSLRVDPFDRNTRGLRGVAHRREIRHRRHSGEVLHQYAGGLEPDLRACSLRHAGRNECRECVAAPLAEQVFRQHPQ